MPNETLGLSLENKERISPEETEYLGEVALEAIPVAIDPDPASLIHKEFPSLSPRPGERVGRIRQEIAPNKAIVSTPEGLQQPQSPEAHNLAVFEELLGHQLPEALKQELATLKAEMVEGIKKELLTLDELREALETEPCASWIKDGKIEVPSIAVAASEQFTEILKQKISEHLKSEVGQKDLEEKSLKNLLENPYLTDEDLAKAATLLGIPFSKTKLRLLPKQRAKLTTTITDAAKLRLDGEPEYDAYSDKQVVVTPERKAAREKSAIESELLQLVRPAKAIFKAELEKPGTSGIYVLDKDERFLPGLPGEVIRLEKAKNEAVSTLLQAETDNPLEKTVSAIARGNLTLEEAAAILAEADGFTSSGSIAFTPFKDSETTKLTRMLVEPSLLGLDIEEADLDLISSGFDKLDEIAALLGRKPENKSQHIDRVKEDITAQQKAFFEKIGSSYDMYWHFSPFGLQIIESKQLSPSAATGNRFTGQHSQSIHFIKPGFFGQEGAIDYTGYAQRELRLGVSGEKHISEPFGIAVIYPLGEIVNELPIRDEPARDDRTSEDVVFRENDSNSNDPQRSLPLEKAFILPMQTMEQLDKLRTNPKYQDIFTAEWQPREELAEQATRRALLLSGYSEEWVDKHVLPPISSSDIRPDVAEVYTKTSAQIRARLPEDRGIILPIRAKRGVFESHDGHAKADSVWREQLIKL